jgi:5-methylcytosine-specific restriction endonuclease McrA
VITAGEIRRVFRKTVDARAGIRKSGITGRERKKISDKTGGACHVCGGKLGKGGQVDHVVPHKWGGSSQDSNYLPACRDCNRLRWGYRPEVIRLMLLFGRHAKQEIRHDGSLAKALIDLALHSRARASAR